MREGKLSGGEYYAVKNSKEGMLYGLEEEEKHKENIKRLGYILDNQGRYKEVLKKIERQIKYLVDKYSNKNSRRFNDQVKRYRENKIKADRFYVLLNKHIEKINGKPKKYSNILPINKEEYGNISKYEELLGKEIRIKEKEVREELEGLLKEVKELVPYYVYKKLMEKTDNGKEVSSLCIYLRHICKRYSIDMARYENLEVFIKSNEIGMQINPIELVKEERELIEKVREAYERGQEEQEIGFIEDFYGYFIEYIGNKIMYGDCGYVVDNVGKFKELYSKYVVVNEVESVDKDLKILEEYYKLNNERNEIFMKNIAKVMEAEPEEMEDKKREEGIVVKGVDRKEIVKEEDRIDNNIVEECLGRAKEIVIVITGGYHSEGMSKILESKGISNIVITPSVIGDIERAERIYGGIVKDEVKILKAGLNYTIMSQMPEVERLKYFVNAGIEIIRDQAIVGK
jgi:hypothetical protein